jgi:uncharacterized membrane protein YebE (DUF533 family)
MSNLTAITLNDVSDELLVEICRAAEVIACECPGYIARLLRQVRSFRQYTMSCTEQFPADAETHQWLAAQAEAVEKILLQTMVELMQREGLIDDTQRIALDKLSDRARRIVLTQVGAI